MGGSTVFISQFHNHAQKLKVKYSGGSLDNQTWQTEWKTAPLVKEQLCEYKNQTWEAFIAASHLYAKSDCLVYNGMLVPVRTSFNLRQRRE